MMGTIKKSDVTRQPARWVTSFMGTSPSNNCWRLRLAVVYRVFATVNLLPLGRCNVPTPPSSKLVYNPMNTIVIGCYRYHKP